MVNHSRKKRETYLTVLALAAFLANSCAPIVFSIANPTETARTPIPTGTEIATPTATPTPEATATLDISKFANVEPTTSLDLRNLDKLAYVSPEDAVSLEFDFWINQLEAQGKLPDFQDRNTLKGWIFGQVFWQVRNQPYSRDPNLPYPIAVVKSLTYNSGVYYEPKRRPDVYEAYFKTKVNGHDYVIWVQRWLCLVKDNKTVSEHNIKYLESFDNIRQWWAQYNGPEANAQGVTFISLPTIYMDNPNFGRYPYADRSYFEDYWKTNKDEMMKVVMDFQDPNSSNYLVFNANFDKFLWSPSGFGVSTPKSGKIYNIPNPQP